MQSFIDFLVNNYLWFLVISLILIFALIGYLVDTNEKKIEVNIDENTLEEKDQEDILNNKLSKQNVEVLDGIKKE